MFNIGRTSYTCPTCFLECRSSGGLTQHTNSAHRQFTPESDDDAPSPTYHYHPHLTGKCVLKPHDNVLTTRIAKPCNEDGEFLPPYTRPPAPPEGDPWGPFQSSTDFEFAYYHFVEVQNSATLIDKALDLWVSQIARFGADVPWKNSKELYATIDDIQHGHSPWVVYKIRYQGPLPPGTVPTWMTQTYDLCARDTRKVLCHQLETTHFKDKINLTPYRQFDGSGQRVWSNLMSADWAWTQAVRCKDGCTFIRVLLICEYI
jgi:Plavaka transposase